MKPLRVVLLLVLALLLPLRGAFAAAMTCHVAGAAAAATAEQRGGHAHAVHEHAARGHATHDHPAATPDPSAPAAADKCNLCAASCSLTPLLGAPPSVVEPTAATAARFPTLDAPAPSFLSDGQERPPRTI